MNFWGLLINGLTSILQNLLSFLPIGIVNPILAQGATILLFMVAPVFFLVGPFINLGLLVSSIVIMLGLESVRAVIAVWRLILKVIPALN